MGGLAMVILQRWHSVSRTGSPTYDHRVSDGVEAAQFMQALADFPENPVSMLV